jgi:hypothetical protein
MSIYIFCKRLIFVFLLVQVTNGLLHAMNLEDQPDETILRIASFLPPKDALTFGLANKRYQCITNDNQLWLPYYKQKIRKSELEPDLEEGVKDWKRFYAFLHSYEKTCLSVIFSNDCPSTTQSLLCLDQALAEDKGIFLPGSDLSDRLQRTRTFYQNFLKFANKGEGEPPTLSSPRVTPARTSSSILLEQTYKNLLTLGKNGDEKAKVDFMKLVCQKADQLDFIDIDELYQNIADCLETENVPDFFYPYDNNMEELPSREERLLQLKESNHRFFRKLYALALRHGYLNEQRPLSERQLELLELSQKGDAEAAQVYLQWIQEACYSLHKEIRLIERDYNIIALAASIARPNVKSPFVTKFYNSYHIYDPALALHSEFLSKRVYILEKSWTYFKKRGHLPRSFPEEYDGCILHEIPEIEPIEEDNFSFRNITRSFQELYLYIPSMEEWELVIGNLKEQWESTFGEKGTLAIGVFITLFTFYEIIFGNS